MSFQKQGQVSRMPMQAAPVLGAQLSGAPAKQRSGAAPSWANELGILCLP